MRLVGSQNGFAVALDWTVLVLESCAVRSTTTVKGTGCARDGALPMVYINSLIRMTDISSYDIGSSSFHWCWSHEFIRHWLLGIASFPGEGYCFLDLAVWLGACITVGSFGTL